MGRKPQFNDPYHVEHARRSKLSYYRVQPDRIIKATGRNLKLWRRRRVVCQKCKKEFELGQYVARTRKNHYHESCYQQLFAGKVPGEY